jgi:hypothetical protein
MSSPPRDATFTFAWNGIRTGTNLKKTLLFACSLLFSVTGPRAQNETGTPARSATGSEQTPAASRYTVIPGLKISPEVGIGVGTMVVNPASPRPGSRMEYRVLLTTRGQAEVRVSNRTRNFLGSRWEARFEGDLQRFLDNYFGGGNDPEDADEVEYIPTGGYAFTSWSRPVPGNLVPSVNFVGGARVDAYRINHIARVDGGPGADSILGPGVTGYRGGVADQWTVGLEYDTRDNRDVPSRGLWAAHSFGTSLAGTSTFQSSESWFAAYETLGRHWEVAGKVWQKTLFGDPPFFVEPNLGNEDVLRGVPHKRFRDKSAQAVQTEIRFGFPLALPLIRSWLGKDWQIAAYGETGRVGSDFGEASRVRLHYSGGVGGRLIFNDRVGAMRGDVAFSPHGLAFIVKFNQAF